MSGRYFCAIPARGGSERLPRKNVRPLAGRPMISYTIDAALQSGCFDAVYVCTEDGEIAEVARAAGAMVPELVPAELTGALVASHRPCEWLRERVMPESDVLVCLQPTSPLRSSEDIRAGVARFELGGVDFIVSVTPIDPHYFHWAVEPAEADRWHLVFGDRYMVERPLLPSIFRPNGSIKIARVEALRRTGNFFGEPLGAIETPEARSVHVATALDAEVCEMLLRRVRA
jgi:CMP-N,N'-diacetyllegionaminic acid synthase